MSNKSRTPPSGVVRTRIAPSPTGFLHLGTARAALFNYLFARKNKGTFVLRIEDTDLERSDPKFEKDIFDGLLWLMIDWDEGPAMAESKNEKKDQRYIGKFGPYRQSERIETYARYIKKLFKDGRVYHCFCTEEELEAERKARMAKGLAPKYSGKCRNFSKDEVKKKIAEGKKSIIRFKIPENRKIKYRDLIRKELEFDSNLIGDIAIAKDEKTPLYNFAVVVDDYLMQISHVIRGEDHISNTPKQLLLQEALKFPHPQYAHLPLILGPDHSKLSKRHGAMSIIEFKKAGFLPQAMLNFMAFLGWNPKSKKEIFFKEELILEFDLKNVGLAGAVFDIKKLDWINGRYIREMSLGELTELCVPYLMEAGYIEKIKNKNKKIKIIETKKEITFETLKKVIALEQKRMKKLSEIKDLLDFYFKKDIEYDRRLLIWKKTDPKIIKNNLSILHLFFEKSPEKEFERKNLEIKIKDLMAKEKMGVGETLWPMRVALSGKRGSPGPFEMAEVMDKEIILERIKKAIFKL